jgi:type IX secretion system PorP/SprF family membrane protein
MQQKVYILLVFALIIQATASAQQTPITSQYLTNGLVINPAYAGTRGALSVNLSYRKQWANISGAPQFKNLSLHTPVNKKEKVSLGFVAEYVTYGVTKDVGIYGFYAYSVRLGPGKLSMGLKGGMDLSNTNYSILRFPDGNPQDPLLTGSIKYSLPNFGAGFYYYTDKYFAGLSIPSLMTFKRDEQNEFKVSPDYKMFKTYFTTGALIHFSDAWEDHTG